MSSERPFLASVESGNHVRVLPVPVEQQGLIRGIGQRLRAARRARGLSLDDVARAAGLHKTYLSKIELGHREVPAMTLFRICQVLDADIAAVINGVEVIPGRPLDGDAPLELQSLSAPQERRIQLVRACLQPGWLCRIPAAEPGSAITFVSLQGTCELRTDRETHLLGEGDCVTITLRTSFTWFTAEDASSCVISATPSTDRFGLWLRLSAFLEPVRA
ncbi:helix-turn-helix domain-containing protein [Arthrobacter sp. TmT3-37]